MINLKELKKLVLMMSLALLLTAFSFGVVKCFIVKDINIYQYVLVELIFVVLQYILIFAEGKVK